MWSVGTSELVASAEILKMIKEKRTSLSDHEDDALSIPYDFLLSPCNGILNCGLPLAPGFEFKISFDRAKAEQALISKTLNDGAEAGSVIKLKNLFLKARYFTSPYLRNLFSTIEEKDIKYTFDECSCYLKNLPQGEQNIRLSNIIGGLTPKYVFAGVIKSDALNGNYQLSSTKFARHAVTEFDLTLNGASCNGFPIMNTNGSAIAVYNKWLTSTNRYLNNKCAAQIEPLDFKRFHFIYGHKFEGEVTEQGWLGIDMKLEKPYDENFTLGKQNLFKICKIINCFSSLDNQ